MEPERQEVYERIPWETLEKKTSDRQWAVYAAAGAVVLGSLAYSFMRSQPAAAPAHEEVAAPTVSATSAPSNIDSPPSTVASPIVVAEADLYAVDHEQLASQAAGHAEWFAVEFVAVDGSDESRETLSSLLPEGVPLPEAPEGTQVFVDWARASTVSPLGPTSFEIGVLVRSLVSVGDSGFVRQPPLVVTVAVDIGGDGVPQVSGVPSIGVPAPGKTTDLDLVPVPEDLRAEVEAHGEVIGGLQRDDGGWEVVVLAKGPDGVRRPVTIRP